MPPKSTRKRKNDETIRETTTPEEDVEPPKVAVIERLWQGPAGFPDFLQGYASLSDFFVEHPELNPYTMEPWSMDDYAFLTNYADLMSSRSFAASGPVDPIVPVRDTVDKVDHPVHHPMAAAVCNAAGSVGPEDTNMAIDTADDVPLTREQLREARIKYYQKTFNNS